VHPTDEDRARAARPVLDELLRAVGERDVEALGGCFGDEVAWLGRDETIHGRAAAVHRLCHIADRATGWTGPRQHGAKAVVRWTGEGADEGALVVEVRRGIIIFVAES
jgi:hypothetical protein